MRYLAFIILIFSFTSCDKKIIDNLGSNLPLNKEFVIENGSTKNNLEENISLQMVSVANEEKEIRRNPVKRISELLRKVFAKQDSNRN